MKDSISFVYNESQTQYRVKIHDDYIIVRDGFSGKKGIYTNREADITMTDYMPDECMQDPVIISRMQDVTYGYQCDDDGNIVSDGTVPDRSVSGHYMDTRSQQLNEIHFSQGKVVFTKDNKFPRVQTMTVYDHYGQFVKEIRFNYYTPNDRVIQRYFLKSVVTVNKEGKAEETFSRYDSYGRLQEAWLPAEIADEHYNPGEYIPFKDFKKHTDKDPSSYLYTIYEQSQLDRPTEEYGAGDEWQCQYKAVQTEYQLTNIEGDTLQNCIHYQIMGGTENCDTRYTCLHTGRRAT